MVERLRAIRLMVGVAYHADPPRAIGALTLSVLTQVGGIGVALSLGLLADSVAAEERDRALMASLMLATVLAVTTMVSRTGVTVRAELQERTALALDKRLVGLSAGTYGIEHHECPRYSDQMTILRGQHVSLAETSSSVVNGAAVLVRLVLTVGFLGRVHPMLLSLPLFGLPSVWAGVRAEHRNQKTVEQVAPLRRLEYLLHRLAFDAQAGKELRLFGLGDELVSRHDYARGEADRIEDHTSRRVMLSFVVCWLAFGLGFIAALLLVSAEAIAGRASVGEVVVALTLTSQLNHGITGLVGTFNWLVRNLQVAARFLWLIDHAAEAASRAMALEAKPVPRVLQNGVTFDAVAFRYPGTSHAVIDQVDLHLPAGSMVAVVGDNGAGKTTLVKLLCRFYEPTSGSIRVDGTDVRCFDVAEWRGRISAAFQDFARFELLASEAIGVGELARMDDLAAVHAALERAQASEISSQLPAGLATQLGSSFDEGTELSTGQWQKLALARAMMREQPLLLLLDEPTAAFDAETEHDLFERYASAASIAARLSGAITVLVSHRLSTAARADLIVVVANGRVTEVGSHTELLAAGGGYAELYSLQACSYR